MQAPILISFTKEADTNELPISSLKMASAEMNQQLFDAAKTGNLNGVKQCIVQNADINAPNQFKQWTPLHVAVGFARENAISILKYLISAGANVEAKDSDGRTALHLAARSGKIEALQYLLSTGVDMETQTNTGATPLLLAVGGGSFQATKVLLDSGANAEAKDKFGKNALNRADDKGHEKIAAYLKGEEYVEEENPQMQQLNSMLSSLTQLSALKKGAQSDAQAMGIDIEEVKRRAQAANKPKPSAYKPKPSAYKAPQRAPQSQEVKAELEELRFDHNSLKKVVMDQAKEIAELKKTVQLLMKHAQGGGEIA